MKYKLLGNSGLRVSELSLGTMTFGEDWGWGANQEESRKMFEMYVEAGGNFIDTANNYTQGTSEKFVGDFIAAERERFVVATKYSLATRRGDPNAAGNHRKNMVQAVEASLKNLKTDYIDLYWLHAWDFTTPIEEVMRGLDDLVRAGKIVYIGISDTPAWVISQANALAALRGWTSFVGLQIEYNLTQRTAERDLLPMAHYCNLGVTSWSPLASGFLSGKYSQDKLRTGRISKDTPISPRNWSIIAEVQAVADEVGKSPSHVALAWVRQKGTIPILGARKADQLKDNLDSLHLTLSAEQLTRLDKVSGIELGFPHDFIQSELLRDMVTAGTDASIEKPFQYGL